VLPHGSAPPWTGQDTLVAVFGSGEHVPNRPATLQLLHPLVQALSQQTPSVQNNPDWQSEVSVQSWPLAAGPQRWLLHLLGTAHCELAPVPVHELKQLVPSMLQTYGAHTTSVPARHRPAPSQVAAVVLTPAAHFCAAQMVDEPYFRHAPEPLQVPSFPQLAGPASLQTPAGSRPPA
jgi:hypothetical protein